MQLVEVVKTDQTDPAIFAKAMDFTRSLKKTPVPYKEGGPCKEGGRWAV